MSGDSPLYVYTNMELLPGFMALSFSSPITTWSVLVPVKLGIPLSVIVIGIL